MSRFGHAFLILSLSLLSSTMRADAFEDRYGLGVVHVVPYNFFSLDFWKNPEDVSAFDHISFRRDSVPFSLRCGFATTGDDSVPAWFEPEIFILNPAPRRLDMCCLDRDGNWCNVVVNKKTNETKWVELGFDVTFLEWADFFKTISNLGFNSPDKLLYEKPDQKAKADPVVQQGAYQVIKSLNLDGMWMQVDIIEQDANHVEISRRQGWIKWRDSSQMLVNYVL
jgi:hypothetical protein